MKISKLNVVLFLALLTFVACRKDDEDLPNSLDEQLESILIDASNGQGLSHYLLPDSDDFANIPQDPKNPLTADKVALGKLLYHETGLGISPMMDGSEGQFSCASCHFASAGFQANRFQGISEGGQGFGINGEGRVRNPDYAVIDMDVQPIRTPTAMNTAFQTNMLWNGQFGATGVNSGTDAYWTPGTPMAVNELGYEGLETQAIAGLAVHRMDISTLPGIIEDLGYKAMFDNVFSDFPEADRYSSETTGLAIAAYERTLFSNRAPFQSYLRGDLNALGIDEKRGAILFFSEAGCANCHNGPSLSKMEFHAIGLSDLFDCPEETFKTTEDNRENFGRGGFTLQSEDMYKFKTPQLYNLTDSPFLGHGSSFRSVKDIINYKNQAVAENSDVPDSQLSEYFVPLNLTETEINDITAFIERSLHDPSLERYVPDELPSGNCFPFNDPIARVDLGCE